MFLMDLLADKDFIFKNNDFEVVSLELETLQRFKIFIENHKTSYFLDPTWGVDHTEMKEKKDSFTMNTFLQDFLQDLVKDEVLGILISEFKLNLDIINFNLNVMTNRGSGTLPLII